MVLCLQSWQDLPMPFFSKTSDSYAHILRSTYEKRIYLIARKWDFWLLYIFQYRFFSGFSSIGFFPTHRLLSPKNNSVMDIQKISEEDKEVGPNLLDE